MTYAERLDEAWAAHLAPRTPDAPTVVSTFAGCGGSSLGYSMAGYREVLAVEWDANAVATFKLNFPGVPVYAGDIAALSVEQALEMSGLKAGELDVLDGSPPCQGFSMAGKRRFLDARNGLFGEYVRLLTGLRPRAFVMENVSGLVRGKMRLIFVECLRALKAAGYQVSARVLNAMYFGVPQSRERLIFLGVRADTTAPPTYPRALMMPIPVREAWVGLDPSRQDEAMSHCWVSVREGSKTALRLQRTPQGGQVGTFGGSKRLAWRGVAGSVLTGGLCPGYPGSSWPSHPTEARGISVREAARLSSFPDAFRFPPDWRAAATRIGNSVPPLFMRAIAVHIRQHILGVLST